MARESRSPPRFFRFFIPMQAWPSRCCGHHLVKRVCLFFNAGVAKQVLRPPLVRESVFVLIMQAWPNGLRHLATNQKIAGSSPAVCIFYK